MNDKNINIVLSANHNLDTNKDPIVILRAGYYEKIKDHEICRIPKKAKEKNIITCDTCYSIYDNTLDEAILIYCVDGEGVLNSKKGKYLIKKGYFAFCDKNTIHAYKSNKKNPWTIYWFHFLGEFSTYFAKEINAINSCKVLEYGYSRELVSKMQYIIDLLKTHYDYLKITTANGYLKVCLGEILINLLENYNQTNEFHDIVEKTIRYMKENLSNKLSLDEIANNIGLSKYYFSRKFKIVTGYSPVEYFNQLKIQKACDLLGSNKYNVKEVSLLLGYSTPYYFSESFKKTTGFSPNKYKKIRSSKY